MGTGGGVSAESARCNCRREGGREGEREGGIKGLSSHHGGVSKMSKVSNYNQPTYRCGLQRLSAAPEQAISYHCFLLSHSEQ